MRKLRFVQRATHGSLQVWHLDAGAAASPSTDQDRADLAGALVQWMHATSSHENLTESVWLEATHLHEHGATQLVSTHAREWGPRIGFGIHPEGPLPRMWTREDFSGAHAESTPPAFNNQIIEISRPAGYMSAIAAMAGRGVLLIVLVAGSVDAWKQEMDRVLRPMVKEGAFQAYPYFLPLLSEKSANLPRASEFMGSARVYLREIPEENGFVLLTLVPLEPALTALGGKKIAEGAWEVPQ